MIDENAGRFEVVWPRSERQVSVTPLASRPISLEKRRVVQLWDYMFRGDEVFELLEEGLRERFPNVEFVSWREFGSTHGQDEREILASFPKRFRELGVDVAISGMGC